MQSVVELVTKYLVPILLGVIGTLLALLKLRGSQVQNLRYQVSKAESAKELAQIDQQLKEQEKIVEDYKNKYHATVDVHGDNS